MRAVPTPAVDMERAGLAGPAVAARHEDDVRRGIAADVAERGLETFGPGSRGS